MMRFKSIPFIAAIGLVVFFSGCISNQEATKPIGQVSPTPISSPIPIISPAATQISQSIEQNKINELENKTNSVQQQINDLQIKTERLGLPRPSNKSLIPKPPFILEVTFAEWNGATSWIFKENGQVEIKDPERPQEIIETSYTPFFNNNTIRIRPTSKYDLYGLVLYDDYVTAIYESGWIIWVKKYHIHHVT
jgi:hypothetical protein